MILAMDVGNTNIKFAVFDGRDLVKSWRVATSTSYTSDEYGIIVSGMFRQSQLEMGAIKGIMVSSVVPSINFTIEHMCRDFFAAEPRFVGPGLKTGINILYENPRELGTDRICNAVAAYAQYGSPCITIDFGTATSMGAVSGRGNFIGGCILAGVRMSREAVVTGTSKLPHFELVTPEKVINRTTISNLQAGLLYGYAGQIGYLIARMKEEMEAPGAAVVATGGFAAQMAKQTSAIQHVDSLLTLKGIRMIYEKNFA
ncbi:MAG TPA: type III pantothenate kinase [Candidatus Limnocylindria bacterium]|nr:type III pantothenate kinase [Candidatus Limnocylindria bacterium]